MSMNMLASVAAGGALGAVARYLVMVALSGVITGFPLGTLVVNVVGSFILGGVIELSALLWSPSAELRAFVVVGMMGAFTTFSTFSLDVVTLMTRGQMGAGLIYLGLSVALSILALYMGMSVVKYFITTA